MAGKREAPSWVAPPKAALVLYKNKGGLAALELFDIEGDELCRPRIPDKRTMADIARACNMADEENGALKGNARNCLTVSGQNMVFVQPPSEQNVIVGYSGDNTKNIRIWCPTTVFAYSFSGGDHMLNVFWTPLKAEELFFSKLFNEKFFACELPNIDTDGSVCLGNSMTKVEYNSDIATMQAAVIRSFYGSTFNEWRRPRLGKVFNVLKKCRDMPEERRHDHFWNHPVMTEGSSVVEIEITNDGIDF